MQHYKFSSYSSLSCFKFLVNWLKLKAHQLFSFFFSVSSLFSSDYSIDFVGFFFPSLFLLVTHLLGCEKWKRWWAQVIFHKTLSGGIDIPKAVELNRKKQKRERHSKNTDNRGPRTCLGSVFRPKFFALVILVKIIL